MLRKIAFSLLLTCACLSVLSAKTPSPEAKALSEPVAAEHPNLSIDHRSLPAVVWFYAPWCAYCKNMYPGILEAEKRFSNQLYILVVDVDDKRNAALVKKYRPDPDAGIPYTQFYDAKGRFIDDELGAIDGPNFLGRLKQYFDFK